MMRATLGLIDSGVTGYPATTSLLLHGDGADGGTVFTDSSIYNASITKNGTVTTSATNPKFGTASILCAASSNLVIPHNARLSFGTGDFCIDHWFRTPLAVDTYHVPWSKGSGSDMIQLYFTNTGGSYVYLNGVNIVIPAAPTIILPSTWYHFEWSRIGTTMRIFLNGVIVYNATNTSIVNGGTGELRIGRDGVGTSYYRNGQIDEFRIQKGVGGHTANFTPPTAPY